MRRQGCRQAGSRSEREFTAAWEAAELRDAETVLAQLGGWINDYITLTPHSALGMRSPVEYRAEQLTLSSSR